MLSAIARSSAVNATSLQKLRLTHDHDYARALVYLYNRDALPNLDMTSYVSGQNLKPPGDDNPLQLPPVGQTGSSPAPAATGIADPSHSANAVGALLADPGLA